MGAILPDEVPPRPAVICNDMSQAIEVRTIEVHHGSDDARRGVEIPVEQPNDGSLGIDAAAVLAAKRLILVSHESDGAAGGLVFRHHLE